LAPAIEQEGAKELTMAAFTALIVEDYEGFRQFLRFTLQEKTQCRVIGEVSDGLQAVRQAEELQPDLILMDLALPKLNGMEAGRRIRKLCPNSKIIFLSQDSSREVVREALRMGALGYLLKSDATELPIAVNTVLQGMQFVSRRLKTSLISLERTD
jgi:DNA-binding NarL/FixJ family response regulator